MPPKKEIPSVEESLAAISEQLLIIENQIRENRSHFYASMDSLVSTLTTTLTESLSTIITDFKKGQQQHIPSQNHAEVETDEKLYRKPIPVNKASQEKKSLDVRANLFVGILDPNVDEKLLYDTFSSSGVIVTNPKIMRDPETGNSRGIGFISYDSFEASDAAIEAMNGQYLCNRQKTISYVYKKDTKGQHHGTPAERVLAASNPTSKSWPHTLSASRPPTLANGPLQLNNSGFHSTITLLKRVFEIATTQTQVRQPLSLECMKVLSVRFNVLEVIPVGYSLGEKNVLIFDPGGYLPYSDVGLVDKTLVNGGGIDTSLIRLHNLKSPYLSQISNSSCNRIEVLVLYRLNYRN